MHEMGMCQAVLAKVEQRAQGRRVAEVRVQVGQALAVLPEVFEQGFAVLAHGGPAQDATVDVMTVPGEELTLVSLRYAAAEHEAVAAPATSTGGR